MGLSEYEVYPPLKKDSDEQLGLHRVGRVEGWYRGILSTSVLGNPELLTDEIVDALKIETSSARPRVDRFFKAREARFYELFMFKYGKFVPQNSLDYIEKLKGNRINVQNAGLMAAIYKYPERFEAIQANYENLDIGSSALLEEFGLGFVKVDASPPSTQEFYRSLVAELIAKGNLDDRLRISSCAIDYYSNMIALALPPKKGKSLNKYREEVGFRWYEGKVAKFGDDMHKITFGLSVGLKKVSEIYDDIFATSSLTSDGQLHLW